jgi:hypothetical protein
MYKSPAIKWFIILAIIIVANMLFNYGLAGVFEKPNFDSVCSEEELLEEYSDSQKCIQDGGKWETTFVEDLGIEVNYCDKYDHCNGLLEAERTEYEQKSFVALVSVGIVILVISLLVKIPTLSIAFALTAFVDFVFATIRYWEYSNETIKIGILFVALLVLIFIAITRYGYLKKNGEIQS